MEDGLTINRPPAGKILSLDGLRGVSFLIVFVAHAGLNEIVPGRLGVNIFFLLSGYLITTLMIREHRKTGWISLKLFYARRTLRIFPPMYTIMAATLLYLWAVHQLGTVTLAGVASQALYYQNYYFHQGIGLIPGLGVLWSLAVEEHFYLLFPPLMVCLLTRFKMSYLQIASTLLCLCAAIFAWRSFVVMVFPHGLEWARDTTDCRADSILFGCALASWEQGALVNPARIKGLLEKAVLPGCFLLLLFTLVYRNPVFRETFRYTIQGIALSPILYYVVHNADGWIGRVLNMRWLAMLGTLSYALYLIHNTVLIEVSLLQIPSKIVTGLVSLVLSIGLAYLVHIWVEKPTEALRKRFRNTRPPEHLARALEPRDLHIESSLSAK
jgi:peptidoglycan/LPS O-acetylase OafA/YrhL